MLGTATLTPTTPVIAGKHGTWTIRYTVGLLGIDSGGQILVAIRLVSDWGSPQFDQPTAENYSTVTIQSAEDVKIQPSWQPRSHVRPKNTAIVLDVYDGSLNPGDVVTLILGETEFGSPGMQVQTYQESHFEFFVLVDPTNSCDPRPIVDRLTLPVVAAEIDRLACLLPSQALVGRPIPIFVKGEDVWRNPTPAPDGAVFEWIGSGTAEIDTEAGTLTLSEAGAGYLQVTADRFSCRSNPIEVSTSHPASKRFWGDLHGQTGTTVGVGSDDEYFAFGREWAKLDFTSHQGNDFQISDDYWAELNETFARHHEEHKFVVFPGYEWSGSSPTGGDHNIFYRKEGLPILRSSHWLVPEVPENELSPAHPADVFYEKMKRAVPASDVIVCQHVGGRYANLRKYFDQELISLVELVSDWGVFEWMLWDAFDKGYIVGVMANSDGHHGRPGAEGAGLSHFGIENGLTCALAPELTRDTVFDALKSRQCYATTGARLLLEFTANDHQMGRVIPYTSELKIEASVTGTGPLESLQLFQGKEVIAEVRPSAFDDVNGSNRIRVSWSGSRERGRQRRVTWDGAVRLAGCKLISADTFSFDVVADGITAQSPYEVAFVSKTTGDRDGLDLVLSDAGQGKLIFDSAAGQVAVDLAELTAEEPRKTFDFGGVDMQVVVERYPVAVSTLRLELSETVEVPADGQTPYFVKATQVDGQMAWASPIYVLQPGSGSREV